MGVATCWQCGKLIVTADGKPIIPVKRTLALTQEPVRLHPEGSCVTDFDIAQALPRAAVRPRLDRSDEPEDYPRFR